MESGHETGAGDTNVQSIADLFTSRRWKTKNSTYLPHPPELLFLAIISSCPRTHISILSFWVYRVQVQQCAMNVCTGCREQDRRLSSQEEIRGKGGTMAWHSQLTFKVSCEIQNPGLIPARHSLLRCPFRPVMNLYFIPFNNDSFGHTVLFSW